MNSEEISAIITGAFAVTAAAVAGYYRVRAARPEKSADERPKPRAPITVTPPPGASAPDRDARLRGNGPRQQGVPRPATSSADAPTRRVLPLVQPDELYRGLGSQELDVEFITDVQFTLKDDDRFIFDDNSEEPR